MSTRGLRNNNPGNIRINNEVFQGEITPSADRSFKQFKNMPYGYRAIFVVLGTYLKQGINTVESIIARWAPSNENNTEAYIRAVEQQSGINRKETLTRHDGKKYIEIVKAISKVENGIPAYPADVEEGFKLQTKITDGRND